MSSTQHQLIEQCATRLRGIVEALDNIHDNTPHRWSTDLDDVHSSAESLLALIKDQAPTQAAQGLAGAALAQPSPAQSEQAEAERPEVVAYRTIGRHEKHQHPHYALNYYKQNAEDQAAHWRERGCEVSEDELMTVTQHDRIVGALRAERDGAIKLLGQSVWQKIERLTQERDAALARVAELTATRNRYGVDAHYFNKNLQRILRDFESFTPDELARSLIILAKVADEKVVAQAQHSVPDGASDLCRFLAKLYCELDGLRYSTAKLPAEQIADALIFKWPVLQGARNQLNIKRISEQPYDESKLHSAIAAMLAAAPGKEVPQAWLDVQAERRRQVEAEGWTPEHDDQHADGQMAVAAGYYALACGFPHERDIALGHVPQYWPWDARWWKPKDARSNLVRSCALALAEIERLDRAGISQSPQPGATTASS
ncbi:hypothetical protein [Pseudomonas aeruginosa]|uniref:hypothetical protein n=1 Tax=Pseudomonas aeruginosa TaxID=287 RepID=UPI0025B0F2AF|nr:hypothetical protein [Pseudomonas aeruginosa]MDN2535450.1 hypothetical protein [Pseudomonas aeruginosa]MDN2540947.1 hypothetical protein [Pseudomonas aeruginosa]MDN2546992.1 hypothetical protein [Pseudomonas aeruginosa]